MDFSWLHDIGAPGDPFFIAGPCVIESEAHVLHMASVLREIAHGAGARLIFKASYDKANRTSLSSFRGPGLKEGLRILSRVRETAGLPVLTDVHRDDDCAAVGAVADIIQIPAFLCRQTDLLLAAGRHARIVNIKKGQFMPPAAMAPAVEKVREAGCQRVWLTERGTTFGHGDLVVDFRCIEVMKSMNVPVIFDATHSVQHPSSGGVFTGGSREFVLPLARAAAAIGVHGIFAEVHDRPDEALSDRLTVLPLDQFERLITCALRIARAARANS
ncbi:MAG: 2-dehydro-3-deoxyphosphooctonate aldolase [Myxococcota bacterium]|nr:2-dehydro-3-deoxyphosphooctonate aldolase [Myxococcota bacterium]